MAIGPIHCGTFLLFAAFALLLVSTISAPVFKQISFLNISNGNTESAYGALGYCSSIHTSPATCSSTGLGYPITSAAGNTAGYSYSNNHLDTLTKALILHPIATGLAFLAFLVALLSSHLGFLFASLITFLAFVVSVAAMAIDFALFAMVRHEINDNTSSSATFGNAIWMTLAAVVILFFGQFIVCFSCFGDRRNNRGEGRRSWRGRKGNGVAGQGVYGEQGYVGNQGMAENGRPGVGRAY